MEISSYSEFSILYIISLAYVTNKIWNVFFMLCVLAKIDNMLLLLLLVVVVVVIVNDNNDEDVMGSSRK